MGRAISIALCAVAALVVGLGTTAARANTITLNSGVASSTSPSLDANVTFWLGGSQGPLSNLDFSAARTGQAAYITWNSHWSTALKPDAHWISTVSSATETTDSALYAVPFTVSSIGSPVSLDVSFMVDNGLGDSSRAGLYIDGNAVPNSTWIPDVSGEYFSTPQTFHSADVRSLLDPQATSHYLYFYVLNKANSGNPNPSGLVFSASVDPAPAEVAPLPAAAWMGLALLACLAVGGAWRRRARGRFLS